MAERKLRQGTITERRERRFERVGEIPFTSERKLMTTIERDHEHGGELVAITKGAPDVLLGRCTQVRVALEVVALDDAMRARLLADVDTLTDAALRTLAVAYRPLAPGEDPTAAETLERELVDARMWSSVIQTGLVIAMMTLLTMDFYLPGGLINHTSPGTFDQTLARTAGFTVLVFTSLFTCFTSRSDTTSVFAGLFANTGYGQPSLSHCCCKWRSCTCRS